MQQTFIPHRSHYGWIDEGLGINLFWSEKIVLLIMYFQRLALLLLWDLQWPNLFYQRMSFMYGLLLDFSAHMDGVNPIGQGTIFEGCESICKLVWPVAAMIVLGIWAGAALLDSTPLYYTRNVERIAWTVVRLGFLPYMNTLIRYFVLSEDGNLTNRTQVWSTPISEIGVFLAVVAFFVVLLLAYARSAKQVLFKSRIRHEAFLRARELEYKLRFSCMYRNDRLWMIASYNYEAWFWSLVRCTLDLTLLLVMTFVPVKEGSIVGTCLLALTAFYGLLVADIHRCWSTNVLEHITDLALTIFCIFGVLQVFGVRNAILVDTNLDYFLFGLHAGAVALYLAACAYFFVDGHVLGLLRSAAEKRAAHKWDATFGTADDGGFLQLQDHKIEVYDDEDNAAVEREAFFKAMRKAEVAAEESTERFYIPKQSRFLDVDTSSPHVWPVNGVMINELLRRNTNDHLVDVLRAARKLLDRISALHNTPVLIPTDELKTHIQRLNNCLSICKRQRITHHANIIHPLQATFEDLIEQFTYELRVFSGRSVTTGHNARKMIEVSRYLRARMIQRDRALALISPRMRRILMKLFALRVFIELVEDRPDYLMPAADKPFASASNSLLESDESEEDKPFAGWNKGKQDVFGEAADAMAVFERGDDEGLGNDDDDAVQAEHEAMLAQMLHEKKTQ